MRSLFDFKSCVMQMVGKDTGGSGRAAVPSRRGRTRIGRDMLTPMVTTIG
jgi:hypothetical protein